MVTESQFIGFFIGMYSVILGMVGGMVVYGVLHDYCGWFE